MIRIKRTYEPPARDDGRRILGERLGPGGMTKATLAADASMKEVAPSTEHRKCFDHQVERPRTWEARRHRRTSGTAGRGALRDGSGGS